MVRAIQWLLAVSAAVTLCLGVLTAGVALVQPFPVQKAEVPPRPAPVEHSRGPIPPEFLVADTSGVQALAYRR